MADSPDRDAGANADWAQAWIAQQRALLEEAARAGADAQPEGGGGPSQQWGKQWSELGSSYLAGMQQMMQTMGASGADGTVPSASEMLDALRTAWSNSLAQASAPGGWSDLLNRTPPLGLFREQTEALRAVVAAQVDCQRLEQELAAVLRRVQTDALTLLEARAKARAEAGSPLQGFRDLYDLWVDCSEQVFGTVAHSSAYGHLQGELSNAAMRLRARMQTVIEQNLKRFDLPTRSEINSVHLQLRALRQRVAELEASLVKAGKPAMNQQADATKAASPPRNRKAQAGPVTQRAARKSAKTSRSKSR